MPAISLNFPVPFNLDTEYDTNVLGTENVLFLITWHMFVFSENVCKTSSSGGR
jgi:hypothetical protein